MVLSLRRPTSRPVDADPLSLAGAEVNRSKLGHIPALDGLRGVAILMVMIRHFTPTGEETQHGLAHLIEKTALQGRMGVDLFFVLSGFLITGILLRSKTSPRYFVNFYFRRALRIFPLYYFVVILVTIGLYTLPAWSSYNNLRTHWPYYWFYLTNFLAAHHGWDIVEENRVGLGYLWTLAVEEHFYLLWPFVVWIFSEKSLIRVCLAIMVIAPILRGLSPHLGQQDIAYKILTQCRMDSLATGALLAVLIQYKSRAEVLQRFRWVGLIWIPFAAYIAIRTSEFSGVPDVLIRTFGFSIIAIACATLICVVLGSGWMTTFMTWRPLRFLGVYSYGIYIYHGLLLDYMTDWFGIRRLSLNTNHLWIGILPHYLACISASTLIAVLSYHFLEKPFLKLKRFFR